LFAFSPEAVPLKWPDALPISAERATRFVYDTLGVRVAEVPTLYTRGDIDATGTYDVQAGVARRCNRWRIVLEREVGFRGGGQGSAVRSAREIFVGALTCGGTDHTPRQLPTSTAASTVLVRYTAFKVARPRDTSLTCRLRRRSDSSWSNARDRARPDRFRVRAPSAGQIAHQG
jgi:hypothetical protein